MRKIVYGVMLFSIISCSTPNDITHIEQSNSVIKYGQNQSDIDELRFSNLYTGQQKYPVTCESDCYPASSVVTCESPAQDCNFTGEQTPVYLKTGFSVRWLGHASFHINSPDGSNLLLDPISDSFDWPVNWLADLVAGFSRKAGSWPTDDEIAKVDGVLYSHIHYDHFNKDDIEAIGNKPQYFVPLGFAKHFEDDGFKINEMAWFSAKKMNKLDIKFVPAHHFSSRIQVPYLFNDSNQALWGGWVIEHQGKRLFFAGDTGYSQHFKDINKRYGTMDICLMPIASYFNEENPDWYRYVHTTPEDALTAAAELNCKVMIPWGYGNASWQMGDRSSHSPLLRLLHMHKKLGSKVPLHILNEGESISL